MEENKVKSNFQFIDSYIRNSNMQIHIRNRKESKLELNIEARISEIKEDDKNILTAELRLKNLVKVLDKNTEEVLVNIDVEMAGIFRGENMGKEQFEQFIKYSGTPIISQSIRSYIMNISALGGINTIRLPLINYVEFFKNNDPIEEKE